MNKIDVSTNFFEKCRKTYSSDLIGSGAERVRGVIEYLGKTYVCTGSLYGDAHECYLTEVNESRYFNENPHRYHDHDWKNEHNYCGIRFKYRGSWWVFLRNEITLTPNSAKDAPKKQASLFDFAT